MKIHAGNTNTVHRLVPKEQAKETDLFGPGPRPEAPKEPREPFMMKVEESADVWGALAGAVGTASMGYFAAKAAGGTMSRVLGVGSGLALIPVGAVAVGLSGLLVGGALDMVTPMEDGGKLFFGIGGLAVGGIGAPIAGWFLGGTEIGGWKAGLLAAGAAVGGLIVGGIVGSNFEDGPATRNYWDARDNYEIAADEYDKRLVEYEKRLSDYRGRLAKDQDIDIELGDDFIVVGDVPLERAE